MAEIHIPRDALPTPSQLAALLAIEDGLSSAIHDREQQILAAGSVRQYNTDPARHALRSAERAVHTARRTLQDLTQIAHADPSTSTGE